MFDQFAGRNPQATWGTRSGRYSHIIHVVTMPPPVPSTLGRSTRGPCHHPAGAAHIAQLVVILLVCHSGHG